MSWQTDAADQLNINANVFVPNINASAFVPSWGPSPTAEPAQVNGVKLPEENAAPAEDWDKMDEGASGDISDTAATTETNKIEPVPLGSNAVEMEMDDDEEEERQAAAKKKKKPEVEIEQKQGKEHISIVFVGHVDAGKSTLGGQIMFLTGEVDKRTLEKYEREAREANRESWYLSWALDTNKEEREKGKTVEVGRAFFETEMKTFTILDAPGHRSYVPNMIGGAAQADVAILVISARKGEFETGFEKGGQTREHTLLIKTAGVKYLVVAINKMDDPTVDWSEERYDEIIDKLTPFIKKSGFNTKKDVHFMPISGLTGLFIKDVPSPNPFPKYTGPSLLGHIDYLPKILRADGPLRLPVAGKYKDMGVVVCGKIESGFLAKNSNLIMMPIKKEVSTISIFTDKEETEMSYTGENVELKLKGVEEEEVSTGFVVCDKTDLCHVCRKFDAQIHIIDYDSIIAPGFSCIIHVHTAIEEVVFKGFLCAVDRKTGKRTENKPRFVKQDDVVIARLEASRPICLEMFSMFPQMGRFTLRYNDR
jgi:peptide chain release factor subunit 3